jgi:sugar lactone lactonase YvrE
MPRRARELIFAFTLVVAVGCGATASRPAPECPAVAPVAVIAPAPVSAVTSASAAPSSSAASPPPPPPDNVVVNDVLGPEGPTFVDGVLYYVGFVSDTLAKWDGKAATTLATYKDCGANGLGLTKAKTLLLACSNEEHGAILEVDLAGKELRRWDKDAKGAAIKGGVNDIAMTATGGAYATVFGAVGMMPREIAGRVLHLAPGANVWTEVARDLNYANGVVVSPDQKTLYVAETVGNAILKLAIGKDGSLSHRTNFALLGALTPTTSRSPWLGPDSMRVDAAGNVYVAQFFGGRVLKIAPSGKLLREFPIATGSGTTSVALDEGEKNLFVTVVASPIDFKTWKGAIVKIANEGP